MSKTTTLKLPKKFLETSVNFLLHNERSRLIVSNLRTLVRGGYTVSGKNIVAFDRIGLVPDHNGDLHLSCILYYEGGDKAFLFKEGCFMDLKPFNRAVQADPYYVLDNAGALRAFVKHHKASK